jgi:DNA gyrase subunit A
VGPADTDAAEVESEVQTERSGFHYRSQNRGGKGIRDIRTTARNGKVVAILAVSADDEVLMVTTGGKIQRLRAGDISVVGRNTQGVRIIRLEGDDKLASMARIPSEIVLETTAVDVPAQPESTTEAPAADSDTSAPNPDSEAESGGEEV